MSIFGKSLPQWAFQLLFTLRSFGALRVPQDEEKDNAAAQTSAELRGDFAVLVRLRDHFLEFVEKGGFVGAGVVA